jgi:DNA replication protein DnaC
VTTFNRRRGLTEEAVDAAVLQAARMPRLPTIRAQFPELAEVAARDQVSYRGFLAELLMAECDDRARRPSERRIKAASFPREKALRAFDFEANGSVDPAVIHTLATCEWVMSCPEFRSGRFLWFQAAFGAAWDR